MKKLILLSAVASAALATPALARDKQWYIEGDAGATIVENFDVVDTSGPTPTPVGTIDTKTGYDFGGIVGYDFGLLRLEAEASYRRAAVKDTTSITRTGSNTPTAVAPVYSGKVDSLSFMANALLDVGPDDGLQGFIGGGVGVARGGIKLVDNATTLVDDSDSRFAWQLIAGVRVPVSSHVDLGLKYRFFNQEKLRLVDANTDPYTAKPRSHSLLATLTYNFGGAEAPPPPPPPPPPLEPPPGAPPPRGSPDCRRRSASSGPGRSAA